MYSTVSPRPPRWSHSPGQDSAIAPTPAALRRSSLSDVLGVLIWIRVECPSAEWSYFEDMCFRPDRRLPSMAGDNHSSPLPIAESQLEKWSSALNWRRAFYQSQTRRLDQLLDSVINRNHNSNRRLTFSLLPILSSLRLSRVCSHRV